MRGNMSYNIRMQQYYPMFLDLLESDDPWALQNIHIVNIAQFEIFDSYAGISH